MRRMACVCILALASAAGALAGEPSGFDRAARTAEVRAIENAFAASVMENKPEVFSSFIDEDAVFVGGSGSKRGRAEIVEAWKGFFAEGRPSFEWHAEVVELSGDGTLGLTRGPWTIRFKDKEGNEVEQAGLFNSVWRRQADGGWKIVFDAGCSPCPKCAP